MASFDEIWIWKLDSSEPRLNYLFTEVINSIHKHPYPKKVSEIKANILTTLDTYPHYKNYFFECLSFSLKHRLNCQDIKDFKEKNNKGVTVTELIQRNIKVIEDFLTWSKSVEKSVVSKENNYVDAIWFKVGLLFANGEMQKLLEKHNQNYTHIANELGNKSYRPYISESVSNSTQNDKNIFNNQSKLLKIQGYCNGKNITIVQDFLKHIKPIES